MKLLVFLFLIFVEKNSSKGIVGSLTLNDDDDEPINEFDEIGIEDENKEDHSVKGSINSLKLNQKVEIDDKNPTLQELKKKIEDKLKEKAKEMKEEEKKKEKDRVVNLKPKKGNDCKEAKGKCNGDDKKDKKTE